MRCLLPPLPSIFLDEEVASNEEGIDDDTDAAADDIAAAEDIAAVADTADDNDTTMPPKVKPLPTKPTKKDMAAASAKPPPPAAATAAAAAATSFSVDAEDPLGPLLCRRSLRLRRRSISRQRNDAET